MQSYKSSPQKKSNPQQENSVDTPNIDDSYIDYKDEIWLQIFSYLPLTDILTLFKVSQAVRRIASDNVIFEKLCRDNFPRYYEKSLEKYRKLLNRISILEHETKLHEVNVTLDKLNNERNIFWKKKFSKQANKLSKSMHSSLAKKLLSYILLDADLDKVKTLMQNKGSWEELFGKTYETFLFNKPKIKNPAYGFILLQLAAAKQRRDLLDYFFESYDKLPNSQSSNRFLSTTMRPSICKTTWAICCDKVEESSLHPSEPNDFLLSKAIAHKNIRTIKLILKKGNTSPLTSQEISHPLLSALSANDNEMIQLFLDYLSDQKSVDKTLLNKIIHYPFEDINCTTLLHLACAKNNLTAVKQLIQLGADVNLSLPTYSFAVPYKPISVALRFPLIIEQLLKKHGHLIQLNQGGSNVVYQAITSKDIVTLYLIFNLFINNYLKLPIDLFKNKLEKTLNNNSIYRHSHPLALAKALLNWYSNDNQITMFGMKINSSPREFKLEVDKILEELNSIAESEFTADNISYLFDKHLSHHIHNPHLEAIIDIILTRPKIKAQHFIKAVKNLIGLYQTQSLYSNLIASLNTILREDLAPCTMASQLKKAINRYLSKLDAKEQKDIIDPLRAFYLESKQDVILREEDTEFMGFTAPPSNKPSSQSLISCSTVRNPSSFSFHSGKSSAQPSSSGLQPEDYEKLNNARRGKGNK